MRRMGPRDRATPPLRYARSDAVVKFLRLDPDGRYPTSSRWTAAEVAAR